MREPRTYGGATAHTEDAKHCIEYVPEGGRSVAHYQCRRNRGFGKDGLYCKQHAKEYPATDEVAIWYEIDYAGRVCPLRVTGETEKCLYVQYAEGHKSSRQDKADKFRTQKEAYEALLSQLQVRLEAKEREITALNGKIADAKRWLLDAT